MSSVTCNAEARATAQTWLDTIDIQRIEEVTQVYMKELEGDIVTVQDLTALAESNQGKQTFGEEKAVQVAEYAREIKQRGALHYDCSACMVAAYILEKKDELPKAVRDR